MGGELVNDFSKLSNSPWESPSGVNIDRCIRSPGVQCCVLEQTLNPKMTE